MHIVTLNPSDRSLRSCWSFENISDEILPVYESERSVQGAAMKGTDGIFRNPLEILFLGYLKAVSFSDHLDKTGSEPC